MPSHMERRIIDRDPKFGPPLVRDVEVVDGRANLNLPYKNGVANSLYQPTNDNVYSPYAPDYTTENGRMEDNGVSKALLNTSFTTPGIYTMDYFKGLRHSKNLFYANEINLYSKTYRFGVLNPNAAISGVREVLFFTKPDLNILARENDRNDSSLKHPIQLNPDLAGRIFWEDMKEKRFNAIRSLQGSADGWLDPFNHLLQNTVTSNLEIPGLSSEGIETTKNAYGVNITYRGSSEASNDSFDFSLEFKDTKWLDVYYYFKMYEEYETLKHHGLVRPWKPYITSKILHDQFSIYKFLLDDDNETILYFAKFWGVYPKSLPRDTFSNTTFDSGITYSIEFKGQFFDDSDPIILREFNDISYNFYNSRKYQIDVYNDMLGRIDGRAAQSAYVVEEPAKRSPTGFVYKLKWKGDDTE